MRKLLIPLVVGVAILVSQVVTGVSAQTPAVVIPTATPVATATPTPEETIAGCWDCAGGTMTEAERYTAACSAEMLQKYPSMLSTCFPKKWAWVCFSEDPIRNIEAHCEMYRRDLDPLGVFATPAPVPTPEPLPIPELTPEPTPILVPTPEATETVVAP